MTPINAFKPLSKDDLAEVLGVSIRTIENWVNEGNLPAPTKLGNRVYWHPNTFYTWLDQRLSGDCVTADTGKAAIALPVLISENSKTRKQPDSAKTALEKVRHRTQAQLESLSE